MAGGKIFQTKTVDPTDPSIGGKVYQVTQVDPTDPHTQGMVYQVVNVGGGSATIEELNVTPSTSAQTIEATSSVDGYAPVNVAAVTSSIDANIVAGNIKKDITILGVTGSYDAGGGTIEALNVTPSTSAQTITATGGVDGYSPVNVSAVDATIDANITAGNIKSGTTILGVTGSVVELNGETASVTPTTSSQTITPTSPKNAFTEISVSAVTSSIDANIQAGNIKKDVQILGVTGTYEAGGGPTPTGTINITTNGTHDVTNYASASVAVPTTAPSMYVKYAVNNGLLERDGANTPLMNLSGVTEVEQFALFRAFKGNTSISGSIDLSNITKIEQGAFCDAFNGCTGITGNVRVALDNSIYQKYSGNGHTEDFSQFFRGAFKGTGVTSVTLVGNGLVVPQLDKYGYAFAEMFADCSQLTSLDTTNLSGDIKLNLGYSWSPFSNMFARSGLASVNLSGITNISGRDIAIYMFRGCPNLTTVTLGFTTLGSSNNNYVNNQTVASMFADCSALTNIDISKLEKLEGAQTSANQAILKYMFARCTALRKVSFDSLYSIPHRYCFSYTFGGCQSLHIYFPSFNATTFGSYTNALDNMLYDASQDVPSTDCTVHFPSNMQSVIGSWSSVTNGFGGTNTTVLWDLPATVTLTGADTNSYQRNPRFDTVSALGWRKGTDFSVPYYTSGTTDPAVSDTIYSDAACTTPVTTISSIA